MRRALSMAVAAALLLLPIGQSVARAATTCATKSATYTYADRFEWYNGFGSQIYYNKIKLTGTFCWDGTKVWAKSGTKPTYSNVSGPYINATQPPYYSSGTGYTMSYLNYGVYAVRSGLGPVYMRVYPRLRVGINGFTSAFDNSAKIANNLGTAYHEYDPVFVSATHN